MRSNLRKALSFSLYFLPLFLIFLWIYPKLLPIYEQPVLAVANPLLGRLSTPLRVEADADGALVAYIQWPGEERRPLYQGDYHPYVLFLNLLLFPPLILATPAKIGRRLRWLVYGLLMLFVVHVLALVGFFQSHVCLARDPDDFLCEWTNGLALTSGQLSAVVVWSLLTWSYWFPQPSAAVPVKVRGRLGRNVPCPCGSGRKYKDCCGR